MSRYIDAEWLLNFFEPYPDDYQTPLGSLRACVDDAPTIEPKRGTWIDFKNGWKCNACNKWNSEKSNFCPNCGANMRNKDDDQ